MEKEFKELKKEESIKFFNSLYNAKIINKHGCFVDLYELEEYCKQRNFLLDDGVAGYSIRNGDLVGVHKNPELAKEKGYGKISGLLLLSALENGANTVDCYGNFLVDMYMAYGFVPVGRMRFDSSYNETWDEKKFGLPDVVALCRAVRSEDEILKLKRNGKMLKYNQVKNRIPVYDNYEKMLKDRDDVFYQIAINNLSYEESTHWLYDDEEIDIYEYEHK
jgi:hypothetical protein